MASSRRWLRVSSAGASASGTAQVAISARSSSSVSGSTSGGSKRGAFTPGNGSVWISPPAVSQDAKRRTASWRMRAVPGAAPVSSSPAIQELSAARLIGRWSPSAHQRR